jgi:hypothetical protein
LDAAAILVRFDAAALVRAGAFFFAARFLPRNTDAAPNATAPTNAGSMRTIFSSMENLYSL